MNLKYLLILMEAELDKAKDKFLHDLYYKKNFKVGRDALFEYVSKILRNTSISRRYIQNWLNHQTVNQLYSQRKPETDIRPIITNRPGAMLQMDLIDFSNKPSKGYRYILTVVDVFSRKCFLNEIKNKTVASVIPALNNIVQEIQKDHVIQVIHSDLGNEFNIQLPRIKLLQSRGYNAQSQGIVERSNRTIKNILFKIMYEKKTKQWQPLLNDVEEVYNATLNRTIGMSPDEAYYLDKDKQAELHTKVKNSKAKSYKEIDTLLTVGTRVRVVVPALKIKKKGLPTYSTEIYTISKVIKGSAKNFTIPRYKLTSSDDVLQKNTFPISKLLVLPDTYEE